MELIIKCPACDQQSRPPWDKVPRGRLRTTCNGCGNQFTMDKEAGVNCRVVRTAEGPAYDDGGWQVDHPACKGMEYDMDGIKGLIRSGMVRMDTRVLPRGERAHLKAGDINAFRSALEQWESKNLGRGRTTQY